MRGAVVQKKLLATALFASAISACVPALAERSTSGIDARYRWQRRNPGAAIPSASVVAYRRGLSPFLAASCALYPHDSAALTFTQERCGAWRGLLAAMERTYFEPDRANAYGDAFLKDDEWLYEDAPPSCSP